MTEHRNTFAGNPLDREAARRRDEAWVSAQIRSAEALFLPIRNLTFPMRQVDGAMRLAWSTLPGGADTERHPPLLLGTSGGAPRFAINADAAGSLDPFNLPDNAAYTDLRAAAPVLDADDTAIAAQARSFLDWHERHRFCAVCGKPTVAAQGGIFRRCSACPAEHFPRTDPVVITVVIDPAPRPLPAWDGRRPGQRACFPPWPDSSTTASRSRDAVRREVAEEAGIDTINIRYHSSQPWPFPSSLMIGCHAEAGTSEINYDEWEMDDVRWFTRDEIRRALQEPAAQLGQPASPDGRLALPGPMAIAHTLILAWAAGRV